MLRFLTLICLVFIVFSAFSKVVDVAVAEKVAINFYNKKFGNQYDKAILIKEQHVISTNSISDIFIFNFNPEGFVIISAEDRITPVLGYSYEGSYSNNNQPPAFKECISNFAKQIEWSRANTPEQAPIDVTQAWLSYISYIPSVSDKSLKSNVSVEYLVLSKWNQGLYYNEFCPKDTAGEADRAYVGCTATSMAQIMDYFKYPAQGQGSHSYYHHTYGTISADFGNTTYNWIAMPNSLTKSNLAVATLSFHCGVAVDMNYGPQGSGASLVNAAYAFTNYFRYSSKVELIQRYDYRDTDWKNIIISNINKRMPVLYAGFPGDGTAGHAFVCDGYQDSSYFHFNWGWGGLFDGYFNVDNLNPASTNFNMWQQAIINIYPKTNYPVFCSSMTTVKSTEGVIWDGSSDLNYQNNSDCRWLIQPDETNDEIINLTIKIERLKTEANKDLLIVYDGTSIDDKVLRTFSGTDISSAQVNSSGKSLLIRFISDADVTDEGWSLSYSTNTKVYCSNTITLTASADTLSDGSGKFNYSNYSNCKWLIKPVSSFKRITLHFIDFKTEANQDFVKIVDPTLNPPLLIAAFSGNQIPPDISANNGQMLIIFMSDMNNRNSGWTATYSVSNDIEENPDVSYFNVFPNPANDRINLSIALKNNNFINFINIFNTSGQMVYSVQSVCNDGQPVCHVERSETSINLQNLPSGMYCLRVVTNKSIINRKLIIK